MSITLRVGLLVLAIQVLLGTAWAQRLQAHTYTELDGLPASRIRSVVQDTDGSMWFATRRGIAIYDGVTWEVHGRAEGLPSEDLRWLTLDDDGALWALCNAEDLLLARWSGERWESLPPIAVPVWSSSGFEVDSATGQVFVATNVGLFRFEGEQWSTAPVFSEPVLGLARMGRDLFIGSQAGLHRLPMDRPDGNPQVVLHERAEPVRGLQREDNRLWIVGEDRVGWTEGGVYHSLAEPIDLSPLAQSAIQIEGDRAGGVLFATWDAVGWLTKQREVKWLSPETGLVARGASDIHCDREGNLWVVGARGVTKIVDRRFENLSSKSGLFDDEVTAVLERRSGEIVLGHEGGLTFLGSERRTLDIGGGVGDGRVMGLQEDDRGSLWVATSGLGLLEIEAAGKKRWRRPLGGKGTLGCVLFDGEGLWIGSSSGLLRLRSPEDAKSEFEEVLLDGKGPSIRRLELARDGSILVGTQTRGVFRLGVDGEEQHWSAREHRQRSVFSLHEKKDGVLWVGTEDGLMTVMDGELRPTQDPDPVIDHSIYFIEPTPQGTFWFGTDAGVVHWSDGEQNWYGPAQGLAGFETNRDAGCVDRKGQVWIGTDRGVSVYDPKHDRKTRPGPVVELVSIDAGEETVSLGSDQTEIEARGDSLAFRFRAISFVDENHVRFRYKLEGSDKQWIGPTRLSTRELRYARLPPGNYRFFIEAIDVNDRVSETASSPMVKIPVPVHQQPWLIAVEIVLGIGVLWILVARASSIRYAHRLEQEVERRSRQLARSQRELAADRERLSVAMSSITEGVAATDSEGRVFLWNAAAERLTGHEADNVIGYPLRQALGASNDAELERMLDALLAGEIEHPDGLTVEIPEVERLFEVSGAPLHGGSTNIQGAVIAFRDITQRRAWERDVASEQRLEALGLLAGGIAHDFNNYLTVISGTLEIISRDTELSEALRKCIHLAEETLHRAVSLTQQLLTFSKGGAPICRPVSIEELVRETVDFTLSGSALSTEISISPDLRHARVDEGQIAEVLHNLLLNARQAMPEAGAIRIDLRNLDTAPRGLSEGHYVQISVTDQGKGISPEDQPHVFDPFFSRRDGGTGLGLAVAHSVVQRHGGKIAVDSKVSCGTTFRIQLPATTERAPELQPQVPQTSGIRGQILLMDDEPGIRRVLTTMLEHLGYEPVAVEEGKKAVELYRKALEARDPFVAVILDLTIRGGLGGLETLERLLEVDPDARVVATTGYSTEGVVGQHEKFGFKASLAKPFKLKKLAAVLDEVLAGLGSLA